MKENAKRVLSMLMAVIMLLQYMPTVAFAAAEDGLCAHHLEHNADCHYAEAVEGQICTQVW